MGALAPDIIMGKKSRRLKDRVGGLINYEFLDKAKFSLNRKTFQL